VTDFYVATRCLYEGENAVQTGVQPDAIDPQRVAVVRGRVVDRNGEPIEGAKVTVLHHPEFGETLTRSDGLYDLAVHGGGALTLRFEAPERLRVQRRATVEWRRFVSYPEVVLLEAEAPVDSVTPEALTTPVLVSGRQQVDQSEQGQGLHSASEQPSSPAGRLVTLYLRARLDSLGALSVARFNLARFPQVVLLLASRQQLPWEHGKT
jgi:hypothetical protein